MKPTTMLTTILCAAMLWTFGAWVQKWNRCDPRYYFITPATCTTYGEQAAKSMGQMREAIDEENATIAAVSKTCSRPKF